MKVTDVKKVAVFGAGTMGPGLAQMFAASGYEVAMYSRKAETLDKAVAMVKANYETLIAHGAATQADADAFQPPTALGAPPATAATPASSEIPS